MNRVQLHRAIIADDNHLIRQSLRAFLVATTAHVQIDEAQNGHQVLDMVASNPPDLVLMDAEMPQVNGIDATRTIKSGWPEVRVIVIIIEPHHRQLALQAGADACILRGGPSEQLLYAIALIGFEVSPGNPKPLIFPGK